jgi:hypothetical protein
VVFLQQYDQGKLLQEQVLRVAEQDVRKKVLKKKGDKKKGWLAQRGFGLDGNGGRHPKLQ